MSKKYKFNTPPGQSIDRKLYLCCGNYGTSESPLWGRLGRHVEDSSAEMDWGEETKKNILGDTWTNMKTPVITQTFDPSDLDSGDDYQQLVWNLAVVQSGYAQNPSVCRGRRRKSLCGAVPQLHGEAHRSGRTRRRKPDDAG